MTRPALAPPRAAAADGRRPGAVPARPLTAAALWALAAVLYLTAEAFAARAFPGYGYAGNLISDLGIPGTGTSGGRPIDSPRAAVMNTAFVAHGLLFLAGAVLVARVAAPAFVACAAVHAVGIAVVGLVPASLDGAGGGGLHVAGAAGAIGGGACAMLVAGVVLRRLGRHRAAAMSIAFGTTELVCIAVFSLPGEVLVPDGTWERGAVYPLIVWELLAVLVLHRFPVRPRPTG